MTKAQICRIIPTVLGGYIAASLTGAALYSDEFDQLRQLFLGYLVIPATFLFYGIVILAPRFFRAHPVWLWRSSAFLFVSHLWGLLLLANAITGQKSERVAHLNLKKDSVYTYSYKRGGFGWLYKKRHF